MAIATNSPDLAAAALDALATAGIRFAVLHDEKAVALRTVSSDIDIVVGIPGRRVIESSRRVIEESGLIPVVIWPYNYGGLTVFLITRTADRGVQLDMLFDPDGRGRYGLRSEAAIRSSREGIRWPVLDRDIELAYLLRKRHLKGDSATLKELLTVARQRWQSGLPDHVEDALSSVAARQIASLVAGRLDKNAGPGARHRIQNGPRVLNRIARPIGFWVEISGVGRDGEAQELVGKFGNILPHVGCSPRPEAFNKNLFWWARQVAPVRWRPGLYVSTAERGSAWADLSLEAGQPGNVERLVGAMSARLALEVS